MKKQFYKEKLGKGFTLVELLVVVAIIAILSVIGLTVFTSAQSNARDARRKADIDAIANALEVSRGSGSVYYLELDATKLSAGEVPVDSSTAKYCIKTVLSGAALPTDPTSANWLNTESCEDGTWFSIPSGGLTASANATEVTSATKFGWQVTGWKVCARLEASTNTIYCKPSSQ